MRRELPWIGQSPELISGRHHRAIGKARLLLDFYVDRQTSAEGTDGVVYYGRTLKFRWIRSHIPNSPCLRTLKRYNARLKAGGYIDVRSVSEKGESGRRFVVGMKVRILNQTKFRSTNPRQLNMFSAPIVPIAVGKPVQNPVEIAVVGGDRSVPRVVTEVSPQRFKTLETTQEETSNTRAPIPRAMPANSEAERRQAMKARRTLGEIDRVREIYAGSFYAEDLARRDQKLELLAEQLQTTGWQEERAGNEDERRSDPRV